MAATTEAVTDEDLISAARDARQKAYAPYSNFWVGAALLTTDGNVFTGCNVENASYGLTVCAERVAAFTAVSAGQQYFSKIAVVVNKGGSPCGACRQVLREFGTTTCTVLMADEHGKLVRRTTVEELLPHSFGPESLE